MGSASYQSVRAELGAVATISRGKDLIEPRYWVFLGICGFGMFLARVVPFALLTGPMCCGIFFALRKHARGEAVRFGDLFRGFDYFLDSLIVALVTVGVFIVTLVPLTMGFLMVLAYIDSQVSWRYQDWYLAFGISSFGLVLLALAAGLWLCCLFAFALIVDRQTAGLDAIGMALRGLRQNLSGAARLIALNVLMLVASGLCCGVGAVFVLPLSFASIWIAYEAIFPPPTSA